MAQKIRPEELLNNEVVFGVVFAPTLLSVGIMTKSLTRLLRYRDGNVKMPWRIVLHPLYRI